MGTSSIPPSPHAGPLSGTSLFEVFADIVARLAQSATVGEEVPAVLETLREVVGGDECILWLDGPNGMVRAGMARRPGLRPPQGRAAALLTTEMQAIVADPTVPAPGSFVAPMTAGGRRMGALGVQVGRPLADEERVLLRAAADLLGPALAQAEYSHHLEVEVALRTREIDEQHRFMGNVVDSLPVGLYVIDREYRIQAWNRKRETGTQGVSRAEALGRTIFEILHRQPAEMLRREFDDVFRTGRMQQFQMESRATGEARTFRISKIPMRLDADGPVTHVITIGEDVTEWRDALDRISQAEKLAAIGTLAAGVMHEINNPMATIAACAESVQLRLDDARGSGAAVPADTGDLLRLIDNEVHRCKRIIDGLLDFSRPKGAVREVVDINDVVERTLFLLKHHARFKKLRVNEEFDRRMPARLLGNPEQLIQVFMALLINAMDAMGEMGAITIRTRPGFPPSEGIVAEVIDEGPGIARSEMGKIFEPFYTTKPPGRGTGLGLSICYGIVADHGGRIEVESAPGKGSTFRILLPDASA
jgi:two-component system, NtrC family, sensor kinase